MKIMIKIILLLKRICSRVKKRFTDYWFGYVLVTRHHITCLDNSEKLYDISIIVGRFKEAQCLDSIDPDIINQLIDKLTNIGKKKLHFRIDFGSSAYQEYYFNKYQQKLLLDKLIKIKNEEIFYIEED